MTTSPGSALAAMRKTGDVICSVCGQTFHARLNPTRNTRRFCSNRCKQADKYARLKGIERGHVLRAVRPLVTAPVLESLKADLAIQDWSGDWTATSTARAVTVRQTGDHQFDIEVASHPQ